MLLAGCNVGYLARGAYEEARVLWNRKPIPLVIANPDLAPEIRVKLETVLAVRDFARDHDLIVVLKGHRTLVVKPDGEVWVNTTGNPGMATGGTGDVLTGITAGLVAQNPKRPFEAVIAAEKGPAKVNPNSPNQTSNPGNKQN